MNAPQDLGRGLGCGAQDQGIGAASCGYTSTWLTWIHTENFAAWNDTPWGTNENGLAGTPELEIASPLYVKAFPGTG